MSPASVSAQPALPAQASATPAPAATGQPKAFAQQLAQERANAPNPDDETRAATQVDAADDKDAAADRDLDRLLSQLAGQEALAPAPDTPTRLTLSGLALAAKAAVDGTADGPATAEAEAALAGPDLWPGQGAGAATADRAALGSGTGPGDADTGLETALLHDAAQSDMSDSGQAESGSGGSVHSPHTLAAPGIAPTAGAATPAGVPTGTVAEARLPASPGHPDFAPQLGAQIALFVREGVQQARLQLNPAEMGPITVQIRLDGGAAQVLLAAEHALTRQALEQALPTLAGSLREGGLTLTGGGVFEQPGQAGQGTAGEAGEAGRGRSDRDDRGTAHTDRNVAHELLMPLPGGARSRGVVDLVA